MLGIDRVPENDVAPQVEEIVEGVVGHGWRLRDEAHLENCRAS